jgi:hypothetical protein
VSGFAYWLAFDEAPRDSTSTHGLRFNGERVLEALKLTYLAWYAHQRDRANNPLDYQEDAYAAELTGSAHDFNLTAGFEVLEGNGVKGFTTPLATFNKFLGAAEKFGTTPPNGLKREYVSAGLTRKGVLGLDSLSGTVVYHNFESSRRSIDYGNETDLQLQGKWQHFTGLLKYGSYRAHSFATDTKKYWLQLEYVL